MSLLGRVQIGEPGYLAAYFPETVLQPAVRQRPGVVEDLPRFRHRNLFGNDPGMQRTTDGTQTVQGVDGAEGAA